MAFTVLWLLQPESYWFVLVTSYTPYAFPGYLIATAALALLWRGTEAALRRWISGALVVSVLGAVFHAALLAPLYVGHHPSGPADLTVVSLNAKRGHADADDVVRLVTDEKAQVLVLDEVTRDLRGRLTAAGLDDLLPNVGGIPAQDAAGTMVFSKYPLTESAELPLTHGGYRFKVAAPTPFWLVAVHAAQPLVAPGDWRADWSVLNQVVPELSGPVLLVGDFNTTLDHPPLRDLLGRGFSDAARNANSGWQPTWPSGGLGLMAIDHVISSGPYRAISTSTFTVGGTDHHGLVARLAAR